MIDDDNLQADLPLVNSEKISQLLGLYKVPLFFLIPGLVLFAISFLLLYKNRLGEESVVFTSESSASATAKIQVDIEGAVLKPGVYTLAEGSRILDALVLAGGLSEKADRDYITKNLNKAAKLVDGSKIFIPASGETSGSNSSLPVQAGKVAGITSGTVNINSASQSDLEALPGVGPVTAGKIISGRPYQSIDELKTKKILGSALFEKLKDLITVY